MVWISMARQIDVLNISVTSPTITGLKEKSSHSLFSFLGVSPLVPQTASQQMDMTIIEYDSLELIMVE